MNKVLTKKEQLVTSTGAKYYKLWFENQWFVVNKWTYQPAKLLEVFEYLCNTKEGVEYDFKYRKATLKGRQVNLITSIKEAEVEFQWDSEEIDEEPSPQPTQTTTPQYNIKEAHPLDTVFACHMCGEPMSNCTCEIPF